MKNFRNITWILLSFFALACSKEETGNNTDTANIMLIHASPDAPSVDAYTDTLKLNGTVLSYSGATEYLPIYAGSRSISVKTGGTNTTLFNTPAYPFVKNKFYSLFIVDSATRASVVAFEDNLMPPASRKTHFRILHLSPNTGRVDYILRSGPDSIAISDKAFKSVSDLYAIDGKTYDIRVKLTGTQNVIASATGVTLNTGKVHTLFLKGFTGGAGASALGVQTIINK